MANIQIPYKTLSDFKATLLAPSLTSTYAARIFLPSSNKFATFLNNRYNRSFIKGIDSTTLLELECCDATLPGSSLSTVEINNDFPGVTERHAYRRLYDDRTDFTFYVDKDYSSIKIFETWISWIVGEDQYKQVSTSNYSYRVKFPDQYISKIEVIKFEKDYGNSIKYSFIDAYPISINSMPLSYESSQLLKCTVSFTYKRYVQDNLAIGESVLTQSNNDDGLFSNEKNQRQLTTLESQAANKERELILAGRNPPPSSTSSQSGTPPTTTPPK